MKLFPKARFKWVEPLEFMKQRDELTNREGGPVLKSIIMAFITGMMLLVWWVNYIDPDPGKNPPIPAIAIPLALSLGYFVGFIVPIMSRNIPNKIEIHDQWISQYRESNGKYHHWNKLSDYGISEAEEGLFLWLTTRKGNTLMIGIDEAVDLKELSEFLNETKEQCAKGKS